MQKMNTSDFTIEVVKPESPVIPSTDGSDSTNNITNTTQAPNTGLFTGRDDGISTSITIIASLFILTLIIFIVFRYIKKHHNNTTIVSHNFKRHFNDLLSSKRTIACFSLVTILTAVCTFSILNNNTNKNFFNITK